jgi:regulator of sirC expression with transglutaminase-like and TPR domain
MLRLKEELQAMKSLDAANESSELNHEELVELAVEQLAHLFYEQWVFERRRKTHKQP